MDPTVLLYLYHIYYCQEVYRPNCTPLSLSYLLLSGSIMTQLYSSIFIIFTTVRKYNDPTVLLYLCHIYYCQEVYGPTCTPIYLSYLLLSGSIWTQLYSSIFIIFTTVRKYIDPTVLLYLYHIYYCQEVYGPNCTPLSLSYLLLSGSIWTHLYSYIFIIFTTVRKYMDPTILLYLYHIYYCQEVYRPNCTPLSLSYLLLSGSIWTQLYSSIFIIFTTVRKYNDPTVLLYLCHIYYCQEVYRPNYTPLSLSYLLLSGSIMTQLYSSIFVIFTIVRKYMDPPVLLYIYHIYYCQEVYGPNCTPLSLSYLLLSGSI